MSNQKLNLVLKRSVDLFLTNFMIFVSSAGLIDSTKDTDDRKIQTQLCLSNRIL